MLLIWERSFATSAGLVVSALARLEANGTYCRKNAEHLAEHVVESFFRSRIHLLFAHSGGAVREAHVKKM